MTDVLVRIPAALRGFAGGAEELAVTAGTVADVLAQVRVSHPALIQRVLTPEGDARPFVNLFVGRAHIRSLQGMATPVTGGTVLSILPAVAGG